MLHPKNIMQNDIGTYCIDPSADEPIMLINKHIGMDSDFTDKNGKLILGEGMGIDGSLFQTELLMLDSMNKKRIQIWINSPGGVVTDGYDIYTAILKTNTPVDTYCYGCAASIAGVIFQAGRKRIMSDYAWLMYHNPFGGESNDTIKTMTDSIITMISQRSKMTDANVKNMMNRNTYISADEAKIMNLCDEVESSNGINTKYLKKISNNLDFHKECNKVLNSILNTNQINNEPMDAIAKVNMYLKLNESAPHDHTIKAIETIENKALKAEMALKEVEDKLKDKEKADDEEMDKFKTKFKKLEEDKAKNDSELEDCKAKLDAVEKDKLASEKAAKEEKVKDMIEGYAKTGRIKNEETVKLKWKQTAILIGVEEAKNMIEALPLNKEAVTIPSVANTLEAGKINAISLAAKNRMERENKRK